MNKKLERAILLVGLMKQPSDAKLAAKHIAEFLGIMKELVAEKDSQKFSPVELVILDLMQTVRLGYNQRTNVNKAIQDFDEDLAA